MPRGRTALAVLVPLALAACGGPQAADPAPAAVVSIAPVAPVCADGAGDCNGSAADACETDITRSEAHCGACGNACKPGESCVASACRRQRAIAAYSRAACAVISGKAQCWGENLFQAGGGALSVPIRVPALDGALHLSVGEAGVCGVLPSGKVQCLSKGAVEELPVDDAVDVEVGNMFTYVVQRDGRVRQFRDGLEHPLEGVRLEHVTAVTQGLVHTCALHASGEVTCWGPLHFLGPGPALLKLDEERQEAIGKRGVKVRGLKDAVQISAAYGSTCALRKTGEVVCWGNLDRGDEENGFKVEPFTIDGLDDAVEIAMNEGDIVYNHTCALRASGKLACWGAAAFGATGSGDPTETGLAEVKGITGATAVAAGIQFSCALLASGSAACWGSAVQGALGNGVDADPARPVTVPGVTGAVALGLEEGYSCALDRAGQIVCWGDPGAYTDTTRRGVPPRIVSKNPGYKRLFASRTQICAIDDRGAAACFDPVSGKPKQALSGLGRVKEVHGEDPVRVGLAQSGQVFLFRGDGSHKVPINGLADVVSAAPSTGFGNVVCGVRKAGKVACALYPRDVLGQPSSAPRPRAADVDGIADAAAIVFGGPEFCVLHRKGDVTCFLASDIAPRDPGPGGRAPLTPKLRRTTGVEGTTLVGLRGGECAIRTDGRVACWGPNHGGELGVGDRLPRQTPTIVDGLSDVTALATAPGFEGHTCAAKKSGEVLCWGTNTSDQVGQVAPSYAFTPVAVLRPVDP